MGPAPAPPAGSGARRTRSWLWKIGICALLVAAAVLLGVLTTQNQITNKPKKASSTGSAISATTDSAPTPSNPIVASPSASGSDTHLNSALTNANIITPVVTVVTPKPTPAPTAANPTLNSLLGLGTGSLAAKTPAPTTIFQGLTFTAWTALGGSTSTICYPINGTEVVNMVTKPGCTVIVLTRNHTNPYNIRDMMNVTSTKIIIGNPIDIPVLNSTNKIVRMFDGEWPDAPTLEASIRKVHVTPDFFLFTVKDGGTLDLRNVELYKGSGQTVADGRVKLILGGTIRVNVGGRLICEG